MPEFQEVRVRMEDRDVGPFIRFLSEQKNFKLFVVGVDPIKQVLRLPPPETETKLKKGETSPYTYSQRKSRKVWKRIYDLIKNGYQSLADIKVLAGYEEVPHTAARIINTLKKQGYIKGNDGSYAVAKELSDVS